MKVSASSSETEIINNDSSRSTDSNDSSLSIIDELDSIIINDVDINNNTLTANILEACETLILFTNINNYIEICQAQIKSRKKEYKHICPICFQTLGNMGPHQVHADAPKGCYNVARLRYFILTQLNIRFEVNENVTWDPEEHNENYFTSLK